MTTNTVHLQAIGNVPAVPLSDVQADDILMWNFGATSEVVSVIPVTAKMVELTTRTNGATITQRKRSTTLVARVAQ